MSRSGKKNARQKNEGSTADRIAKAAAAEEAPKIGERVGSWLLTIAIVAVAVFFIWRKFNPPAPEPMTSHVAPEKEIAWTSEVDGAAALQLAKDLCAFGPRPVGSEAHKAAQEWIKAHLAAVGFAPDQIREQTFTEKTPKGDRTFTNIVGVLPGEKPDAIAFGAHYDSKLFETFRFVGANDAASAVGLNLELARVLKKRTTTPPPFSYYFVFFDGEEAFNEQWGEQEDGTPDHTYGSRRLAQSRLDFPIKTLVLMDMIGDADFSLVKDDKSTPWLVKLFVELSVETFGINVFKQENSINDDHVPFLEAGVPAIDLIDFQFGLGKGLGQYGYWHTAEDGPDKLAQRGFDMTGTLVLKALPKIEQRLLKEKR
jgi:glutaminyl-peptide cyclotransferase